jgi:hypothetical protein
MNIRKLAVVVVIALCLSGCSVDMTPMRSLTLQISGTSGTHITGQYVLTAAGETTTYELDREVPFTIDLTGQDLSCVVQKIGTPGTVRVQLLIDGEPVAFDWTRENFGNITVTTP